MGLLELIIWGNQAGFSPLFGITTKVNLIFRWAPGVGGTLAPILEQAIVLRNSTIANIEWPAFALSSHVEINIKIALIDFIYPHHTPIN